MLLGFRDQYLAALLPEIEAATTPVMHALTEVVSAHAELRVWMQSGLVADVWGVIQHALDLVQQQVITAGCSTSRVLHSPVFLGRQHSGIATHVTCYVRRCSGGHACICQWSAICTAQYKRASPEPPPLVFSLCG